MRQYCAKWCTGLAICALALGCAGTPGGDTCVAGADCGSWDVPAVEDVAPTDMFDAGDPAVQPARFLPGTTTPHLRTRVGPAGATLVGPPGTPIAGFEVRIPQDALVGEVEVELGSDDGQVLLNDGEPTGQTLDLEFADVTHFEEIVLIGVPMPDEENPPVLFHVGPSGELESVAMLGIDPDRPVLWFGTSHASKYTLVQLAKQPAADRHFTKFKPQLNGFLVENKGTPPFTPGGECFGMAAYSMWHFREGYTPLARMFLDPIKEADGPNVFAQSVVATRAHLSVGGSKWKYAYLCNNFLVMRPDVVFRVMANLLSNTDNPILIYMSGVGESHAVVGYGYEIRGTGDRQRRTIWIYDPNYPGEEKPLLQHGGNLNWDVYDEHQRIVPLGLGVLHTREPFDDIRQDAAMSFHNTTDTMAVRGWEGNLNGVDVVGRHCNHDTTGFFGDGSSDDIRFLPGLGFWHGRALMDEFEVSVNQQVRRFPAPDRDKFTGEIVIPDVATCGWNRIRMRARGVNYREQIIYWPLGYMPLTSGSSLFSFAGTMIPRRDVPRGEDLFCYARMHRCPLADIQYTAAPGGDVRFFVKIPSHVPGGTPNTDELVQQNSGLATVTSFGIKGVRGEGNKPISPPRDPVWNHDYVIEALNNQYDQDGKCVPQQINIVVTLQNSDGAGASVDSSATLDECNVTVEVARFRLLLEAFPGGPIEPL